MKSDSQIREEVIQELRWDPQVTDPDAIGVADELTVRQRQRQELPA